MHEQVIKIFLEFSKALFFFFMKCVKRFILILFAGNLLPKDEVCDLVNQSNKFFLITSF